MDDYAASADLCERNGFDAPAAFLRAVGGGEARVYVIRTAPDSDFDHHFFLYLDHGPYPPGPCEMVFLDRESAEALRREMTTAAIRMFCPPGYLRDIISELPTETFNRRVGEILGADFSPPEGENLPMFPANATDEQLLEIADLLRESFYDVTGIPIAL